MVEGDYPQTIEFFYPLDERNPSKPICASSSANCFTEEDRILFGCAPDAVYIARADIYYVKVHDLAKKHPEGGLVRMLRFKRFDKGRIMGSRPNFMELILTKPEQET